MNSTQRLQIFESLRKELDAINNNTIPLDGINDDHRKGVFIKQLIDSMSRVDYIYILQGANISEKRMDPNSDIFDPIRAAILKSRNDEIEEAFWLTFISIHFGKSESSKWRLAREFYGGYWCEKPWNWENINSDINGFNDWTETYFDIIQNDGITRKFGNHRKYQTLDPTKTRSTKYVALSYLDWINKFGSHLDLIQCSSNECNAVPRDMFKHLFSSMNDVLGFGRLGIFDYLTMAAKVGLVDIEPGSTFITQSTGPKKGARLLFGLPNATAKKLGILLDKLEDKLTLGGMGMQVLEDAICNWQKSPNEYKRFRG